MKSPTMEEIVRLAEWGDSSPSTPSGWSTRKHVVYYSFSTIAVFDPNAGVWVVLLGTHDTIRRSYTRDLIAHVRSTGRTCLVPADPKVFWVAAAAHLLAGG